MEPELELGLEQLYVGFLIVRCLGSKGRSAFMMRREREREQEEGRGEKGESECCITFYDLASEVTQCHCNT